MTHGGDKSFFKEFRCQEIQSCAEEQTKKPEEKNKIGTSFQISLRGERERDGGGRRVEKEINIER